MATTRDIAFWEILKKKVLRCHPDPPPTWLVIFLSNSAPILPYCLCLALLTMGFFKFSVFLRAGNLTQGCHISTRAALQALVTVIVPTCSLWPSRYVELASVFRSHINIPLEVIFNDAVDGVIEIRNSSNDLVDLIGSGTVRNGHTIRISVGWKWWIKYFKWWILAEFNSGRMFGLFDRRHHNTPVSSGPLCPSQPSSPISCPHRLDCLPRGVVPSPNVSRKVSLEFTAFSSSLRTSSMAQIIISAIPFMVSGRPRRRPQSLDSVLKQLTASYGSNIVIDSLLNISVDYERTLHQLCQPSSGEQRIRERWVKMLGVEAWRQERFLAALEAALVRRGWVERWAIQATVK